MPTQGILKTFQITTSPVLARKGYNIFLVVILQWVVRNNFLVEYFSPWLYLTHTPGMYALGGPEYDARKTVRQYGAKYGARYGAQYEARYAPS